MARISQLLAKFRRCSFLASAGMVLAVSATPLRAETRLAESRIEAMLVSAEAETRAVAFSSGRRWASDVEGRDRYARVLWAAWQRQERAFAAALRDGAVAAGLFNNSYRNWRLLTGEALGAVRSGLAGSGKRLRDLDQRFERASHARRDAEARLARALAEVGRVSSVGNSLLEIERELVLIGAREASAETKGVRERLSASADGRAILAAEKRMLAARGGRDAYLEAALHNREQSWAPSGSRKFAKMLNERRHALGLEPLRLERNLWKACAMHAEEMKRLGYFDHLSPDPGRRTPDRRAEIAKFGGTFQGENLYQSPRPSVAENVLRSWWASDSHRYVMFAPEPNAMGLDPGGGTHWALMTGRM